MAERKKRKRIVINEPSERIQTKRPGKQVSITPKFDNTPKFDKAIMVLAEAMSARATLADRLGKSYYGGSGGKAKRDLYKALGYIVDPSFMDYYARYRRQDIAKRVMEASVSACWRKKPVISEGGKKETAFEIAWKGLLKEKRIFHYLYTADLVSGIGRFGVLLMGFSDGLELSEELKPKKGMELTYLKAYTENAITVEEWEDDKGNSRYGMPRVYGILIQDVSKKDKKENKVMVHHSRVLHLAEGLVDGEVYGTPRLESVLNRLQDLELISGGSSEMFWRGGFPGYAFKLDPEAQIDSQALEDVEDEIQDYLHELRRYIRLQGIEVKALEVQISDPSNHFDMLVALIACSTGIPQRILLGSERGELASTQDEKAWADRIDERRKSYVEFVILRAFIDKLVFAGVLPQPEEKDYDVEWPDLMALGDKDRIEIANKLTETMQKYMTSGMDQLIPFEMFAVKYLQWSDSDLIEAKEQIGKEFSTGENIDEDEDELPDADEVVEEVMLQ